MPADLHHDPDALDAAAALAAALAADLDELPTADLEGSLPSHLGAEHDGLRTTVRRAAQEVARLAEELRQAATRSRIAESAALGRFADVLDPGRGDDR
ncbi:MAG: hypothetical protein OJJ54_14920 [Pseudonocardia sp.]|nr:hypothetical protein [Pseudonocardia sp.]